MTKLLLQDTQTLRLRLEESEGGKLIARGEFARADVPTANRRIYPASIWKKNINALRQSINERKVMGECDHPCFIDNDFDVFTEEGWKPFDQVKVGDRVWSRVDQRAVLSEVNAITDAPYSGPAFVVIGRSINAGFTAPHKFVLDRKGKQLEAVLQDIVDSPERYTHCTIPKTAVWDDSSSITEYRIPGIADYDMRNDLVLDAKLFSAFLGIYLSEGSCSADSFDNYAVYINQKTEWIKKAIQSNILDHFPNDIEWTECKAGFYTSDARLYTYLKKLGNAYDKFIPKDVKNLPKECLSELLYWFCMGDGRFVDTHKKEEIDCTFKEKYSSSIMNGDKNTRADVFTVSKALIDDLHECLVKIGRAGTINVIETKKDYLFAGRLIKAENKKPLYQLHFCTSKNIWVDPRFLKFHPIHHEGQIYCLTVTNGNFFVRKNGQTFWTGNCDGKTKLQRVSHLITNLELREDGMVYGEFEVIPDTIHGRQLKALFDANVSIGVSSRGYGSVRMNEAGMDVVQDDYTLLTFDAVSDPANETSYPEFEMKGEDEMSKKNKKEKHTESKVETSTTKETIVEKKDLQEEKPDMQTSSNPTANTIIVAEDAHPLSEAKLNIDDFREQIIKEMLADPNVGEGKVAIEAIKKLFNESMTNKELYLRIKNLIEDTNQLQVVSKDLGYNLWLERNLREHPKFTEIKACLGDMKRIRSLEELKETCKVYVEDVQVFKKQKLIEEKTRIDQFERRIADFQRTLSSLAEEKNKLLEEKSALNHLLNESIQKIRVSEAKVYLEQKIAGNPNASKIRTLFIESKEPLLENKQIDALVEGVQQRVSSQAPIYNQVRESLKKRFPVNNLVEESVKNTTVNDWKKSNSHSSDEIVPGLSKSEFEKLAGINPVS